MPILSNALYSLDSGLDKDKRSVTDIPMVTNIPMVTDIPMITDIPIVTDDGRVPEHTIVGLPLWIFIIAIFLLALGVTFVFWFCRRRSARRMGNINQQPNEQYADRCAETTLV